MKKIVIAIIALLLLAGGAYGAYRVYHHFNKASVLAPQVATNSGGVFGSIQEALSKSLSLQCQYTDQTGKQTTAYIKAGAVRADVVGTNPSEQYNNASIIVKDKKLYIWDNTKKQGMMLAMTDNQVAPTGSPDIMGSLEKYKNDCKPAVVADSQFTPPSDVTFSDISKMMPSGIPTSSIPRGMNQQQYQQYIQQYQAR